MFFNLIFVKICFHHSFMFLPTSLCRRQNGKLNFEVSLYAARHVAFAFSHSKQSREPTCLKHPCIMSSRSSQETINLARSNRALCSGGKSIQFPIRRRMSFNVQILQTLCIIDCWVGKMCHLIGQC